MLLLALGRVDAAHVAADTIDGGETPDLGSNPAIAHALSVAEDDIAINALLVPALSQEGILSDIGELGIPSHER